MPLQKKPDIKKICVIDDNPLILSSIKRALRNSNYEIFGASNREEFVKLLEHETFDLVITDYYLKDCTALEIKTLLYEKSPDTLLIVMSGRDLPGNLSLPSIQKPFSIKDLRSIVDDLLRGKGDEP